VVVVDLQAMSVGWKRRDASNDGVISHRRKPASQDSGPARFLAGVRKHKSHFPTNARIHKPLVATSNPAGLIVIDRCSIAIHSLSNHLYAFKMTLALASSDLWVPVDLVESTGIDTFDAPTDDGGEYETLHPSDASSSSNDEQMDCNHEDVDFAETSISFFHIDGDEDCIPAPSELVASWVAQKQLEQDECASRYLRNTALVEKTVVVPTELIKRSDRAAAKRRELFEKKLVVKVKRQVLLQELKKVRGEMAVLRAKRVELQRMMTPLDADLRWIDESIEMVR
jgi:hypothetical protein